MSLLLIVHPHPLVLDPMRPRIHSVPIDLVVVEQALVDAAIGAVKRAKPALLTPLEAAFVG